MSESLADLNQNQHSLCLNWTLASAAWKICGNSVAEVLADQNIELLGSNQKPDTLYHYKTGWQKRITWCLSRKIDLVCAGARFVLEFLSILFSEGLEFITINGNRSAISAFYKKVEETPIAQHPKVCQLLSVIFSKRPPSPKYTVIWDVSKVVDYTCTFVHKAITLKLTKLFAILRQTEPQS